jgi:predicted transposase/invertase (TIGR01784 family)
MSMAGVNTPHDSFFVKSLGDIDAMREFLELNLPDEIIKNIKVKTISKENTTFVDENLKKLFSDLIFNVELESGNKGYVVFLFEHKSTVEKDTVFQIFKYLARIWDEVISDNRLPVIIPVLFYHGNEKWSAPMKLSGLIEDDIDWADKIIPDFEYFIYTLKDLKKIYPNITVTKLKLYIKTLQLSHSKTKKEFNRRLKNLLIELDKYCKKTGQSVYFRVAMRYILETSARSKTDEEKIIELSKKFIPERKGDIMTVAEELRKEGEQRGIEKGERKILIETVTIQLEKKFNLELPNNILKKIAIADREKLIKIRDNIFDIESLDEVSQVLD